MRFTIPFPPRTKHVYRNQIDAIIVAAEREPDTIVVSTNATLWEFTQNEFGTWGFGGGAGGNESNIVGAFTLTKYL